MKRLVLLAVFSNCVLLAQTQQEPVVLTIDIENHVNYRGTVFDTSKIAKDPGPTSSAPQAFIANINIGDIVAVNGKPAKGVWSSSYAFSTPYRSAPQPGQVMADFDLGSVGECTFQIYATDGTYLGLIRSSGGDSQAYTVTGGGGGFWGVVGTQWGLGATVPARQASTAEDPANRRSLGGGKLRIGFNLYPRVRPAVQVAASGPSVFHADFSPVSSTNLDCRVRRRDRLREGASKSPWGPKSIHTRFCWPRIQRLISVSSGSPFAIRTLITFCMWLGMARKPSHS